MYTIILGLDGKYHCQFRLQDGTEYYTEPTLETAIAHAKKFARIVNGDKKLKKKDIAFYKQEPIQEVKLVPWRP
jgi:hypothetical protein